MIRAGAAQADALGSTTVGLQRLNELPVDLFIDPSEDPEDVFARVNDHLHQAASLIRSAGAALGEACTEVVERETQRWEWRLNRQK
ncbi:hypothetical protein E0H75_41655 [Kribbella capetownensis]|uniref:Uncharacterized protein n=1 Tax=Kribbella capetownensis TaxID=1572659 RepID=A0A4R0IQI9_9ACTN|nr:hypothetical protein [Kribbella capetownensis]TCC35289.1 hypothetical protein E0H75_41655 [Kribbella capetownensis]